MAKWAIIQLQPGQVTVLSKDFKTFTTEIDAAALFSTEEEAREVSRSIKTATIVQELDIKEKSEHVFPVPDYFDANDHFMTLAELLYFIRQDELIQHFTPVDKITGGNQMTGGALFHPVDGSITAREIQFSFSRMLNDDDAVELGECIRRTGAWDYHSYQRKRLGFTGYAVLTLRVKNR